jgi:hypothetical protein
LVETHATSARPDAAGDANRPEVTTSRFGKRILVPGRPPPVKGTRAAFEWMRSPMAIAARKKLL